MNRRGFTLIELLVVIAIMALLISILLPAMSNARRLGKATACLSNMRVMAQAMQMYADNNEGRFPVGGIEHGQHETDTDPWLITMLREYGDKQVTRCPSDGSPYWTTDLPGTGQRRLLSYASNILLAGELPGYDDFTRITRVIQPSTTVFWAELAEEGEFAVVDHVNATWWWSDPEPLASEQVAIYRHIRKANYAMVDGHAESLPFEETYAVIGENSSYEDTEWRHNMYDPNVGW